MKKKLLLTMLLMLALLTAASGAACAESFVMLGSFPAGEALDVAIGWASPDTPVEHGTLPQGLRIESEADGENVRLMLRGTPLYAGDLDFTVQTDEEILCNLTVTPALPSVSVSQDVQCSPGETVELTARAATVDAGTLSYQWYTAGGPINTIVEGAAGNVLRPDTSEPGTVWYCCEVTNTNSGETVSVLSDYVKVQVRERELQSISIESLPTKTEYETGEELDVTGLRIVARYENGYNEIRSEGFTVTPSVFGSPGTHSVTIAFGGKTCGFNVTVKNAEEKVTGIGVLTLPRKTDYTPGERLQTAGLTIRAYTPGGGHVDVSAGLECDPTLLEEEGEQIITVHYGGQTCTFTVHVRDDKVITGITVLSLPVTRSYTVGDRLDTTGLTVQLNSNKGSELLNDGFTVTPKVLTTPGTQAITVIYGQYQAKFNVTVNAREAVTPTPKPTATPAPTTEPETAPETSAEPAAAETAHPVETPPMRKNTGVNTAVKVIFAVAVLALAGLAGYVWYLRRQGYEYEEPGEDEDEEEEPLNTVSGEPLDEEDENKNE